MPIRAGRPDDRADLYAICLRTGAAGTDATGVYEDPDLIGEVYLGAYLALEPTFTLVATGADSDRALGYCVATPDTQRFADLCERDWWPHLRTRYPLDTPRRASDQALVELIHTPPRVPAGVLDRYPAHLHIDLLPALQGAGLGRALMERQFDALAAAGARGVHVGVDPANTGAVAFYRRLGFTRVSPPGTDLVLGRSLD